jgi:hypothetical protein
MLKYYINRGRFKRHGLFQACPGARREKSRLKIERSKEERVTIKSPHVQRGLLPPLGFSWFGQGRLPAPEVRLADGVVWRYAKG